MDFKETDLGGPFNVEVGEGGEECEICHGGQRQRGVDVVDGVALGPICLAGAYVLTAILDQNAQRAFDETIYVPTKLKAPGGYLDNSAVPSALLSA